MTTTPNNVGSATDIDLAALQRYDHQGCCMAPDATGDYLLIADVRDALARATPQHPDLTKLLQRAHRVISCAAIAQIGDGEATWRDLGDYLDGAATPQHSVTEQASECQYPHETDECIGCGWKYKPLASTAATQPDDIRAAGWAVAVHNDYRLNGEAHTFWLFTKDGRAVKGEGKTDAEALAQVRAALAIPASTAASEQQADDLAWHKESLKRHVAKLESVWEGIREAVQKYSGAPCEGEPFDRLDELLSRLTTAAASEQQAGAGQVARFEAWVRKECNMPASAKVNWKAQWTRDSWQAWDAALTHRATTAAKAHAVGASDGFGPTKNGCCGVTVTKRCEGCPYARPQRATTSEAKCKLVPIEPTDEMAVAFAETWFSKVRPIDDCEMEDCYRAMLAAAPDTATTAADQQGDTASASGEAKRQNLALVIARLEQIKHIAEDFDVRTLAEEALVCAEALAQQGAAQAQADVMVGRGYRGGPASAAAAAEWIMIAHSINDRTGETGVKPAIQGDIDPDVPAWLNYLAAEDKDRDAEIPPSLDTASGYDPAEPVFKCWQVRDIVAYVRAAMAVPTTSNGENNG